MLGEYEKNRPQNVAKLTSFSLNGTVLLMVFGIISFMQQVLLFSYK